MMFHAFIGVFIFVSFCRCLVSDYEKVYGTYGFVVSTPVYLFEMYEFIFSIKHKHKHTSNLLRITEFLDFVYRPVF
jgi:hypothetical protein